MDDGDHSSLPTERKVYQGYLQRVRQSVVNATEGLDEEQLRMPGVPSGTSLLGIVHHLAGIEEHWFQKVFLGHMFEETARHAGHADILRERIDGATGL